MVVILIQYKNYILLLIITLIGNIQNQLINPIITSYCKTIGIEATIGSYVFAFFVVGSLVSRFIINRFYKFTGYKIIILCSYILMTISCALYSVVADNYYFIFLVRFIHGFSFALSTTALMAYISHFIDAKNLRIGMGIFGLGQVLSVALGPFFALFISDKFGFNFLFLGSATLNSLGIVLIFFVSNVDERQIIKSVFCKKIIRLSLYAFLLFFVNSLESAYIILYSKSIGITNMWIYFLVSAIFMLISRLFVQKISTKIGFILNIKINFMILALSFILIILANFILYKNLVIFTAGGLKGFSHALILTNLQTESIKRVDTNERAVASSTFYIFCDLGMISSLLISSLFSDNFIMIFALAVPTLLISLIVIKNNSKITQNSI